MLLNFCLFSALFFFAKATDKTIYDVEQAEDLFENFITAYNKTYASEHEKQSRLEIFKANLQKINEMNAKDGAVFAINKFADISSKEFQARYMGFQKGSDRDCGKVVMDDDVNTHDAPAALDWVAKGAVTAVKDQRECGSCWTFGTIGNIEGQYFLKHNQLKSFSEQELIDCSRTEPNNGCYGGIMIIAMIDLVTIGGVQEEKDYPYEGNDSSKCRFDKSKAVAKVTGCTRYNMRDEEKLKEVLAKTGPLTIAVNGMALQFYHGGIMILDDCDPNMLNHAVLLTGYGTDANVDYWQIKNSWSDQFGEKGYFRIRRGNNVCGLMNDFMCSADIA